MNNCEIIPILSSIQACRDPRDDKFLEVAVHDQADLIVTGDCDLLDLHPFRGISILSPAAYLEME
jgi:putative PIN family toxin of toxin-antitoxin system